MFYYCAATVLSTITCWLYGGLQNARDKKEKYLKRITLCLLAFLPIFLVSAFRWDVGTDAWHTYTPEYLAMKSEYTPLTSEEEEIMMECMRLNAYTDLGYTEEEVSELTIDDAYKAFRAAYHHTGKGFQLLERVLIYFNADVQWLYILTSLISLSLVYGAIFRQTENQALACLLFVITGEFFLSLNIVSQFIAISMCLFACSFIEEKKPILFICFIVIACSFHVSALVFAPAYLFSKIKIKPIWCALSVAGVMVMIPVAVPIIKKVVSIVFPRYVSYFGWGAEFEWIFFALDLAVFVVGSYYYNEGCDRPYFRIWYYCNVVGMIVLCFSGNVPLMKRINYYFAAPHFLFLPLIIQCEKNALRRRALTALIIVLFVIETYVSIVLLNKNGVLPYQSVLDYSSYNIDMTLEYVH